MITASVMKGLKNYFVLSYLIMKYGVIAINIFFLFELPFKMIIETKQFASLWKPK